MGELSVKNETVFVTGAAGVIGKQLVKVLADSGLKIIAIDRKKNPFGSEYKNLSYVQMDLNDLSVKEFEAINPNIYVHLAASFERTTERQAFYSENFQDNTRLSSALLFKAVQQKKIKHLIFASSYLVYDEKLYKKKLGAKVKLDENSILCPRNLTGAAKLFHENEMNFMSRHYRDKIFTNLRIFRGIGIGSRCVISRWVRALLRDEGIRAYDIDGEFDYIYCKDVALCINEVINKKVSGTFNLGSGKARKVSDVIKILSSKFPKAKITFEKNSDLLEKSEANIKKLVQKTKFNPKFSLEDAIDEIIEYEKISIKQKCDKNIKLLISSAGNKAAIFESLKKFSKQNENFKFLSGDLNNNNISSKLSNAHINLEKTENKNRDKILNSLKANKISLVLPTRDQELLFWADNKNFFQAEGITIVVSPRVTLEKCLDKLEFYDFCIKEKLEVIPTQITPLSEKMVMKDRYGSGSKGLKIISPEEIIFQEDNDNTIFQPLIEGTEYSFDALSDLDGQFIEGVLRRRDLAVSGESQISTIVENYKARSLCIELINKLKIVGPSVTQLFMLDNKIYFVEVNARIGGATTCSINAGLMVWDFLIDLHSNKLKSSYLKFSEPLKGYQVRSVKDYFL